MILIVDDIPENLFALKSLLQIHQYDVDTASSGEEALRKVLKNEYTLIILDVQMPEMDGFEVAEAITSSSKTKHIAILFLSAVNIDKRFIAKGYNSGGIDYVTKPFDPDLLMLKVKSLYRLQTQARELKSLGDALREEIEIRKAAQKALLDTNSLLEDKVQERTRELLQMNSDLETSNVELQQYANIASHDLQEPLRKIITFGKIIEEKFLVNTDEARMYMQKITSSTERMRHQIEDLLNYSKLSANSQFAPTDINTIIRDTISELELLIEEKDAQIIVDDLPLVETIPGQMRQLFQNLIGNALKFSRAGVSPLIKVWGERTDLRDVLGNTISTGDYLRLYVQDNGIGFDEKYLDRIFVIFQRLHSRSEYEGTGIGLAIVKKIVEKHNGQISARSTLGSGTTFIISLPVKHHVPTAGQIPIG